MTTNNLYNTINTRPARSAWSKGVKVYALELLEDLQTAIDGGFFSADMLSNSKEVRKILLNGAADWSQYSYGGSALICDCDIASRLCSPSELKKTRNGDRNPNSRETWLDVQARALNQACAIICETAKM